MLDINECLSNHTHCDELTARCIDTDGSFMCVCKKGYTGNGTEGNCIGFNLKNSLLLRI